MRNLHSFTERHVRFLTAIRDKVNAIDDPDADIIHHEFYQFHVQQTREFGKIPKIRFKPHSCQVKAELIGNAGFHDEAREKVLVMLRQKYGIATARNKESRLFEAEWNNIMLKLKKATFTVALINQFFSRGDQWVSEPIRLMQNIVLEEFSTLTSSNKKPVLKHDALRSPEKPKINEIKPYDQQLAELD